MKIAFLTDVYKPMVNGVVISVDNFAKGLRKLKNKVYIFAPRYPGYEDEEKYVWRFKIVQKIPANYYLQFPLSIEIGNLIKECDIIHVHHPFVSGILGLYKSKVQKVPLVFTHHTIYEEYAHYMPFIGRTKGFRKRLNKYVVFFCNSCDCVIAPSDGIKKMLKSRGVKKQIEVIPTGIDLKKFRQASGKNVRKKYGDKDVLILYLGRIAKEKNVGMIIEIFKYMNKKNKKIKLLLVGDGPLRKELENKNKNIKNLVFAGRVNEIESFYKAADIFVSASKTETQGLVFAEAKASGLPVVAFNVTGARDMVRDKEDGLLANTKKEFKKNLTRLVKDKKLRGRMSTNALKNSSEYSIEATSRKMLKLYKELVIKKQKE